MVCAGSASAQRVWPSRLRTGEHGCSPCARCQVPGDRPCIPWLKPRAFWPLFYKAVQLLKRMHQRVQRVQRVQRQRRDFQHTTALALLRQCDTIYLEDLQVRTMVRNHHLAKSISDASWAALRTILVLEAKAACAGRQVIAMPPAYTSQDGSGVLPDGSRCPQQAAGRHRPVGAHPCLPVLWLGAWCWTATRTRHAPFCGPGRPGRPLRRQRGPLGRVSPEKPPP
jgi:IS605 OrfB family transposase